MPPTYVSFFSDYYHTVSRMNLLIVDWHDMITDSNYPLLDSKMAHVLFVKEDPGLYDFMRPTDVRKSENFQGINIVPQGNVILNYWS